MLIAVVTLSIVAASSLGCLTWLVYKYRGLYATAKTIRQMYIEQDEVLGKLHLYSALMVAQRDLMDGDVDIEADTDEPDAGTEK